jgi:hypothetical protein
VVSEASSASANADAVSCGAESSSEGETEIV